MKSQRLELFAQIGNQMRAEGYKQPKHGSHRGLKTSLACAFIISRAGGSATREEIVHALNAWTMNNTDKEATRTFRGQALLPGAVEWVDYGPEHTMKIWRNFEYLFSMNAGYNNLGAHINSRGGYAESYYMRKTWRSHFYYRSARSVYSLTKLGKKTLQALKGI